MKFLLVRFSSIGDVTQFLSVIYKIKKVYPESEVHVLTKSAFKKIIDINPAISKVWTISDKAKFKDLRPLLSELQKENFTHIYDAHNNFRSKYFYYNLKAEHKIKRPMFRLKRFLLVYFKINLFKKPFSGQRDFLDPLAAWNITNTLPPTPQFFLSEQDQLDAQKILEDYHIPSKYICFAPSSAHALKRWPLSKWRRLIDNTPHLHYVCLAGPTDTFTEELNDLPNMTNLTGKTSLLQSAALINKAMLSICNDTGLLHFSEQLGKPTIALMGAAPFGFPSREKTIILKKDLPCWPCSKHGQGPCVNPVFHECMDSINADEVKDHILAIMSTAE